MGAMYPGPPGAAMMPPHASMGYPQQPAAAVTAPVPPKREKKSKAKKQGAPEPIVPAVVASSKGKK